MAAERLRSMIEQHEFVDVGQKTASLGGFKTAQGCLVLPKGRLRQTFEIGHFTGMGMPFQPRDLIQHLLKTLLTQGVVEVAEACLQSVVGRPLPWRRSRRTCGCCGALPIRWALR